jgi:hypothetical protein
VGTTAASEFRTSPDPNSKLTRTRFTLACGRKPGLVLPEGEDRLLKALFALKIQ